jgi:hypothetical protein
MSRILLSAVLLGAALALGGCFVTRDDVIPLDRSDVPPTIPGAYDCTYTGLRPDFSGRYVFEVFSAQDRRPRFVVAVDHSSGSVIMRVSFARVSSWLYLMAMESPVPVGTKDAKGWLDILRNTGRFPSTPLKYLLVVRMKKHAFTVLDTIFTEENALNESKAGKRVLALGKSHGVRIKFSTQSGWLALRGSVRNVRAFLHAFARSHEHAPALLECKAHNDSGKLSPAK